MCTDKNGRKKACILTVEVSPADEGGHLLVADGGVEVAEVLSHLVKCCLAVVVGVYALREAVLHFCTATERDIGINRDTEHF